MASWLVPGDAFVARRLREVVGPDERVLARAPGVTLVATPLGIARVRLRRESLAGLPGAAAPTSACGVLDGMAADDDELGAREEPALADLAAVVERCLLRWDAAAGSLPLDLDGTPLQLATWVALRRVGPGRTTTCAELSRLVGARAAEVRRAVLENPVPILVPCHRVADAATREPGRLLAAEAAYA